MLLRVEWKSATTISGALCAMTCGGLQMLMWPADNLDFHQQVHIVTVHCIYFLICFIKCPKCAFTFSASPHLHQVQHLYPLHSLDRELDQSCWIMWAALALRPGFGTAPTMVLVFITVPILKMLVSDVEVSMHV